ncbi:MAG: AAA family ATPase [Burkholderiaceae bacterium]
MRLNQIKLSGFKSFAEPTTFQLPGQRVGVVGPNGCGKSNIMDAVRWVLGESKASELRGESMRDVIFNGSGNRKPASRASVELVFSNEDGRAGGSWNQYAEIAVKRVLTRDGTSSYFINNQPVRRRDIAGRVPGHRPGPARLPSSARARSAASSSPAPRSCACSSKRRPASPSTRSAAARPENRLKDTRENLTRVDDILREGSAPAPTSWSARPRWPRDTAACRSRARSSCTSSGSSSTATPRPRKSVSSSPRWRPPTRSKPAWPSCATSKAEPETVRQAHYAASDALHLKQGDLAQSPGSR